MNSSELRSQISEEFFYDKGVNIAKELIGKFLIKENTGCGSIIVKTEAYLGENDPSCHFAKNSEHRKKIFRKGVGTVYAYKIHGHNCMNIISEYKGNPEGTLIRAIKPSKRVEERGGENGATGIIKQS
jgi:DNA-3-methyladenine glycosylase